MIDSADLQQRSPGLIMASLSKQETDGIAQDSCQEVDARIKNQVINLLGFPGTVGRGMHDSLRPGQQHVRIPEDTSSFVRWPSQYSFQGPNLVISVSIWTLVAVVKLTHISPRFPNIPSLAWTSMKKQLLKIKIYLRWRRNLRLKRLHFRRIGHFS